MHEHEVRDIHAELQQRVADERAGLVQFLRRLDRFDEEMGWALLAYRSLWDYLVRALHLPEGSAWRRANALKLLRRFPELEAPLTDGRLNLTTVELVGKVMTPGNAADLIARSAYLTKRETEELVVSIQPRTVPADGLRKLPQPAARQPAPAAEPPHAPSGLPLAEVAASRDLGSSQARSEAADAPAEQRDQPRSPGKIEPVAAARWQWRHSLDAERKKKLDELRGLLSHKIPDGDLDAVFDQMLEDSLEKHRKRRGAARPVRTRQPAEPTPRPRGERDPIPADVRRQVWARDGGQCTYVSPDERRCDCTWQLEFHHHGGAGNTGSTAKDLTLRCRPHNLYDAVEVFGREHVRRRIEERKQSRRG
jgi:hypothetical protein